MSPKKRHDEDVDIDSSFEEDSEGDAILAKIQKLKDELVACKAEKQEYLDGWQRLKADTINARKAEAERQKRGGQIAQEQLLAELLPIVDGFDMARSGNGWNDIDPNWRIGVEAIISQLENLLTQYGAVRIGKVGEQFNPHLHEAVKEVKGERDGEVVAILRSGWKMGESVLRPAQVSVAHTK
jgi:molecular chaperone GrpE